MEPEYLKTAPVRDSGKNYQPQVLVVDDDDCVRFLYIEKLSQLGFKVFGASESKEAFQILKRFPISAILLDQSLGNEMGTELLPTIFQISPLSKVVFLTSSESIRLANTALSMGAHGFLIKSETLDSNIDRFLKLTEINKLKSREVELRNSEIIGESSSLKNILSQIYRVRNSDTTILLTGESGSGKEMFAKAIHNYSNRKNDPFIAINCAAISENLLEAELFGYRKGAFTDAKTDRKGFFENCTNGTLLLDEIGETSPVLQAKLLRVLQEKEIIPVGSNQPIKVNTRVIAATNRDLKQEIEKKIFREDLYYRLAVLHFHVPPLRERLEDIPLLVEHFLKIFNRQFRKSIKNPNNQIYSRLKSYNWPGNVRELYNAVERSVLLAESDSLAIEDLLPSKQLESQNIERNANTGSYPIDYSEAKDVFEKSYIEQLLRTTNYCITDAAKISNQYRTNIYRLIKKHNINIQRNSDSPS